MCIGRCESFPRLSERRDLTGTHPAYPLCQQTFRKLEMFMSLFLSGIQYYRTMFNFMDSPFYEHADAFIGIQLELKHCYICDGRKVNMSEMPFETFGPVVSSYTHYSPYGISMLPLIANKVTYHST